MSQIIKAKNGEKTPKTYGHLWIDGIDYGNSEEMYNAFAQHARSQGLNQGEFYDQWLTALRNGQDVEFGNGNTVNLKPEDMSDKRAGERSGWTKFWDDTFNTRRNQFSDAIATARRFSYKEPTKEESRKKYDISETLTLDYNKGADGKYSWNKLSTDNQRARSRVDDIFRILRGQDTEYELNDAQGKLKAAYDIANAEGKGDEFLANLWNRVIAAPGYTDLENNEDLEWLNAFNITTKPIGSATTSTTQVATSSTPKPEEIEYELDGKKYKIVDGKLVLVEGQDVKPPVKDENEEEKPQIKQDPKNPTLISYRRAMSMGRPDLAWGVDYNGIKYSVEDIMKPENISLKSYMDRVAEINGRTDLSQSERLKALSDYINIPDDFSAYTDWTSDLSVKGLNLPIDFGKRSVKSAGISEYAPTADGTRIFKYYNNAEVGKNAWGFRNPYYLVYDANGQLKSITPEEESILVSNAGIGDLQKPDLFKNILGTTTLEYKTPVDYSASSIYGQTGSRKMISKSGNFSILRENDKYALVSDTSGKQYIYNKDTKVLVEADAKRIAYYLPSNKQGGTIDFDKVNTLVAKSGGVIKAFGGTSLDTSKFWETAIKGGLAAADYGSMAWGRKKVHDQLEKGIKDSVYRQVTPLYHGITTATPIEDAAVNRYDQYVQRGLTTPLTSDAVTNTQNVLSLQANALGQRDQAVRQQSAAALQRQMQNQQIYNQQEQANAAAENDYRARVASSKMQLAQNDASLTTQQAQSLQNLIREWRTKGEAQMEKLNQLGYNTALSDVTKDLENYWLADIQTNNKDIWDKWQAADKSKYSDFYTWATETDGIWNKVADSYKSIYSDPLAKKTLELYKQYNMSPLLANLYRERVSASKSGGKIRNRYKNEPSEDIWINQNKAAHKAVAKFNDNIIKAFLKTLK